MKMYFLDREIVSRVMVVFLTLTGHSVAGAATIQIDWSGVVTYVGEPLGVVGENESTNVQDTVDAASTIFVGDAASYRVTIEEFGESVGRPADFFGRNVFRVFARYDSAVQEFEVSYGDFSVAGRSGTVVVSNSQIGSPSGNSDRFSVTHESFDNPQTDLERSLGPVGFSVGEDFAWPDSEANLDVGSVSGFFSALGDSVRPITQLSFNFDGSIPGGAAVALAEFDSIELTIVPLPSAAILFTGALAVLALRTGQTKRKRSLHTPYTK